MSPLIKRYSAFDASDFSEVLEISVEFDCSEIRNLSKTKTVRFLGVLALKSSRDVISFPNIL
jgi:hypothetical protein